jgi:hypothetical protein
MLLVIQGLYRTRGSIERWILFLHLVVGCNGQTRRERSSRCALNMVVVTIAP